MNKFLINNYALVFKEKVNEDVYLDFSLTKLRYQALYQVKLNF